MTDYYTDSTENVSKSITISVKDPAPASGSDEPSQNSTPSEPAVPSKSSNANLRNLVVQPVDFTGFRASKTSGYSVTVENDVTEVKIIPTLADSKASYSVSGNTNLKEGTNVVKVTVTAEDGTQKTYQVNVIRKVAGEEITPNTSDDSNENEKNDTIIGLSKLEIKGMTITPEFAVDTYKYMVILEDQQYTLEEIKELIIAEVNFEGGTIEILGDDFLDKDENEIVISVKDADGREIAIYTIVFKYNIIEQTSDTTNIEAPKNLSKNFYLNRNQVIVLTTILLLSLVAIVASINSYRFKRKIKIMKKETVNEEKYDEKDLNNDDEELFKNEPFKREEDKIIEEDKLIENNEVDQDNKEEIQTSTNYISDLFEKKQMEFEADDKDFIKKKGKNKRGKHSS